MEKKELEVKVRKIMKSLKCLPRTLIFTFGKWEQCGDRSELFGERGWQSVEMAWEGGKEEGSWLSWVPHLAFSCSP